MDTPIIKYAIIYLPNNCMFGNRFVIFQDLFCVVWIAISVNQSPIHIPIIAPKKSIGRYQASDQNHISIPIYCDSPDVIHWISNTTITTVVSFRNCVFVFFHP